MTIKYCSRKCGRVLMERLVKTGQFRQKGTEFVPIYRVIEYCPVPNYIKDGHDEIETDRYWWEGKEK